MSWVLTKQDIGPVLNSFISVVCGSTCRVSLVSLLTILFYVYRCVTRRFFVCWNGFVIQSLQIICKFWFYVPYPHFGSLRMCLHTFLCLRIMQFLK